MATWLGHMWGWVRRVTDDALPLPADERVERDLPGPITDADAEAAHRRLKMRMLEKRGKGGTR